MFLRKIREQFFLTARIVSSWIDILPRTRLAAYSSLKRILGLGCRRSVLFPRVIRNNISRRHRRRPASEELRVFARFDKRARCSRRMKCQGQTVPISKCREYWRERWLPNSCNERLISGPTHSIFPRDPETFPPDLFPARAHDPP